MAEADGFDVFITTHKNLRYQQNLSGRRITIVVVMEPRWPKLEPDVDRVVAAVDTATPGSYAEVQIPAH